MSDISKLVEESLRKTNAHGLARPVNEKQLYLRVLWVLVWLVMCGLFVRQFVGFIDKLQANGVTTNYRAESVQFEYPDFNFCYDNPMSGSQHLALSKESAAFINASFEKSRQEWGEWCNEIEDGEEKCDEHKADVAAVQMNSLPYRFLINNMAHVQEQSIFYSLILRTNGLVITERNLLVTDFYHPTHLRCFRVSLNETDRAELKSIGPNDNLYFMLMMDAPDSRMGRPELPVVLTGSGNLTAPYWALDKASLTSRVRDSKITVYITQPGYYPSNFDSTLSLEAGRTYNVQLEMKEQVHNEDPSRCIDKPPNVQMVNPYDNSPYTVKYNYAFCYNSAAQAQFKRELNATCPFLPHPWPPTDHSLYNLSSGWGSVQDVKNYLDGRYRLRPEEPVEKCAAMHPCTRRSYTPIVESVLWPSSDAVESELDGHYFLDHSHYPNAPALKHLRELWDNRGNASQPLLQYVRSNLLQLQVSASNPMADQIIFTRAYNFESFVADVGGILGIYLGMSLLTAFELAQFFHDLVLILFFSSERQEIDGPKDDTMLRDLGANGKVQNGGVFDVRAVKM